MIKIIKKIIKFFQKEKTEIEYVEAALVRYQAKLDKMDRRFDPRLDCCQNCAFPEYSILAAKIERVEHRLKILKSRKKKNEMGSKHHK